MRGASRDAAIVGKNALKAQVTGGADTDVLADDLFAVTAVLDASGSLRRALADPATEGGAKRQVVQRLFSGKVSEPAVRVLGDVVAQRWSDDKDLVATIDTLGVHAALSSAEKAGRLQQVEDELFRFDRIVAGDPALEDTLTNRQNAPEAKADVISRLLEGKTAPETVRLARHAVLAPRGHKFANRVQDVLSVAAERRDKMTAIATVAKALDQVQLDRLAASLEQLYGKPILVHVVVDPAVIGGLKVRIGDEIIDGTIARKLEGARQHLAG